MITEIKGLGENTYGGLNVLERNGKFYSVIGDWDGIPPNIKDWNEISESLYVELINFNNKGK